MSDYDVVYFEQINTEEGLQAERLADLLMWKYEPKSVVDIGCATGLYLRPFRRTGVRVRGIDYSDSVIADRVLQIPRRFIQLSDITKTSPRNKSDLALCIEVLEHIPESGADAAMNYLTKSADLIIFSAAQPGQGGTGHVNCQPKDYWAAKFAVRGFQRQLKDEDYLLTIIKVGYHLGWLTNNLMIFRRQPTKSV